MYYDISGQPITMLEWSALLNKNPDGYKWLARTELPGDVLVSTVWLGLDHSFGSGPPLIFETMIFGGPLSDDTWRYPTSTEALAGHEHAVALARMEADVRAALDQPWD